jgi:hypothetical protein
VYQITDEAATGPYAQSLTLQRLRHTVVKYRFMKVRILKIKKIRKQFVLYLTSVLVLLSLTIIVNQWINQDDGQQPAIDWVSITKIPHQKLVAGGKFSVEETHNIEGYASYSVFYKSPDGTTVPIKDTYTGNGRKQSEIIAISPNGQRAAVLGDGITFADSTTDELYSIEKYGDYSATNTYHFLDGQSWIGNYFVYYADSHDPVHLYTPESDPQNSYSDLHAFNTQNKQNKRLARLTTSKKQRDDDHWTPYSLQAAIIDDRIIYILSRETFYKSTVHERKGEHSYVTAVDPLGKNKHSLAIENSLTSIEFVTCSSHPSPCLKFSSYKNGSYGGKSVYKAYSNNGLNDVDVSSIVGSPYHR